MRQNASGALCSGAGEEHHSVAGGARGRASVELRGVSESVLVCGVVFSLEYGLEKNR